MPRHSKNNTASAVFTYAERDQLRYGTQKQRLGGDSFRPFHACFLCLQSAVDPLCCPQGHIACKECFYESVLAQKKALKRLVKEQGLLIHEIEKAERAMQEDQKAKDILKFQQSVDRIVSTGSPQPPQKDRILPSFWIPSLTPAVDKESNVNELGIKREVLCLSGDAHPVSVKKLFPIKLTKTKETNHQFMCPSCSKQLVNGTKIYVLKSCGHTFCGHCTKEFIRSAKRCIVCDSKSNDRDIIMLSTEGTGFAAHGSVEVKRFDIAFQG